MDTNATTESNLVHGWPRTRSSLIVSAQSGNTPEDARAALAELCQVYWRPIRGFFRARWHNSMEGDDLTQSFIVDLLERGVATYDPSRRRFRHWLRGAAHRYACRVWRRQRAGRREPRQRISWESLREEQKRIWEPALASTPERMFDLSMAVCMVDHIADQTRETYARRGEVERYDVLEPFIAGAENSATSYAEAAAILDLSPETTRKAALDLARCFRTNLRRHVRRLVPSGADVDVELRYMLSRLSPPGRTT